MADMHVIENAAWTAIVFFCRTVNQGKDKERKLQMNPHSLELTAQMARQAALRTLQAAESATEAAAQAYRAYADGLLYTPDPWDVADDDPRITDAVFGMFAASSACSDCRQAIETISKEHKYGRQEEPKTTKHG